MASKNYLIVCTEIGCTEGDSGQLRRSFEPAVGPHLDPDTQITDFNLPQGAKTPKYGSFDNLIKLGDELVKYDSQTEGCLRRLERQYIETFETEEEKLKVEQDEGNHFQVVTGPNFNTIPNFLREGWKWDDAKYPAQRSLQQNVEHLIENVQKLDEDSRNKGQVYSDLKAQKSVLTKKEGVTFPTRDLVDLFDPDVVKKEDFVYTEHLTTVVVILGRGQEAEFKKWYENPEFRTTRMQKVKNEKGEDGQEEVEYVDKIDPPQTVIPDSAQQFKNLVDGAEDKDGNTVWRVVLFRSCKDKFQSLARQNKFTVRDFTFNPKALQELDVKRKAVEKDAEEKLSVLKKFCQLAWSDVFTAWLHIKAMRAFVESVLRNGQDSKTNFAGFIICPKAVTPQLREALARAMPGKGAEFSDDVEEYFPYVSLGFAPRAAQQQA